MTTTTIFPIKDPLESIILTFDFSPALSAGEILTSIVLVTIATIAGTDSTPISVFNGSAVIDSTQTMILQPVSGGLAMCTYEIKATAQTSNTKKVLTVAGLLPVQSF